MLKKIVDIICDMLYSKDARREEIRKEEIGEEAFPCTQMNRFRTLAAGFVENTRPTGKQFRFSNKESPSNGMILQTNRRLSDIN